MKTMFQRGRGEQSIKYKQEVQRHFPNAKWIRVADMGAIFDGDNGKRLSSDYYRVAWQAWESAWGYQHVSAMVK